MGGYADTVSVQSVLRPPEYKAGKSYAEMIRDQGPVIQGVNWIYEQITGENLVEAVITPITGDWPRISANGKAWVNAGDAVEQISGNLSDNLPELEQHWDGDAAEAFQRHIDVAWAVALYAEAGIAKAIAKGFDFIAEQSERLCGKALDLLEKAIAKLLEAAATGWIPVVGWARAAKIIWDVYQIVRMILAIYDMVKTTIEAAQTMMKEVGNIKSALADIPDVRSLSDAMEVGQKLNRSTDSITDSASSVASSTADAARSTVGGVQGGVDLGRGAPVESGSPSRTSGDTGGSSSHSSGSSSGSSDQTGGTSGSSGETGGSSGSGSPSGSRRR